jgi:uncharacterized membrane protein
MLWLVLGLVLFLGSHSVRIFADGWRQQTTARLGEQAWKGAYALVSLAGFALLVWGFGQARLTPDPLWFPPLPMRHIAGLLTLIAFVFLVAAYVPGNAIKARLHHPMVLSVKVWALAHLLANGRLADVVLFGAFLLWAIADFRSLRQRDRAAGTTYPAGKVVPTVITVVVGLAAWAGFAFWGHAWLIGVSPLGV